MTCQLFCGTVIFVLCGGFNPVTGLSNGNIMHYLNNRRFDVSEKE